MSEENIPMNCTQFEEILADINRPEMRETALRESALAHAKSCPRCARLLSESESLDQALRALAAEENRLRAPERVEANLLREFRRQKAAASRRRIRWQVAIGIAAAILVVAGVSLRYRLAPSPRPESVSQTRAGASVPSPATNSAELPAPVAVEPHASVPAAPEKTSRSILPAPSSEQGESEDAAAFMELPYADDPAAVDEGTVVRVVLSRSALASLGLPVEVGSGEPVQADLVISEDGTPQAIRLVSQQSTGGQY